MLCEVSKPSSWSRHAAVEEMVIVPILTAAALIVWWAGPMVMIAIGRRGPGAIDHGLWVRSIFLPFFLFGATGRFWTKSDVTRSAAFGSGLAYIFLIVYGYAVAWREDAKRRRESGPIEPP
jgi:hypothetical protein